MVSIVRLQSLINFATSHNTSRDFYGIALYSSLEIAIGIMCACLPAIRLLIIRGFPSLGSPVGSRNESKHSSNQRSDERGHVAGRLDSDKGTGFGNSVRISSLPRPASLPTHRRRSFSNYVVSPISPLDGPTKPYLDPQYRQYTGRSGSYGQYERHEQRFQAQPYKIDTDLESQTYQQYESLSTPSTPLVSPQPRAFDSMVELTTLRTKDAC